MSTIAQVDPIELRKKLQKLCIGAGFKLSETFAEDAVKETLRWARFPDPDRLPACCPTLRLEPTELAYCLDAWAKLWEAPT